MEAPGFVTHVARNRRVAIELVALYLIAFQLMGGLALSMLILVFDPDHLIINDPVGYLIRYSLPVFAFSALYLALNYYRHSATIERKLKIREVTSYNEQRLVHIAELQCTALGVRLPRFGVLEVPEPNALTVGEGPKRGLIVVTRGLLVALDDDELATVIAHEAAHIKQGDTQLLALNHVFHRTAISLQIENPFRFDHWLVLIIVILIPLALPVFIAGSIATRLAMALTYRARQSLHVRRDYLADAAAIRVTHDPAALISAMRKTAGKGEFAGASRVAGLLFDSRPNAEGFMTVPVTDRIAAVERLSGDLATMARTRRDTRVQKFGVAPPPRAPQPKERWRIYDSDGRPLAAPPRLDLPIISQFLGNKELFDEWLDAMHAYWEWRPSDRRNWLGLKPKMMIPFLATLTFIGVFYWPADGNWRTMATTFNPQRIVEAGRKYGIQSGTFCEGPSYPDGKCPE